MVKFQPFDFDTRYEWDLNLLDETVINSGFIEMNLLIEILKRQERDIMDLKKQIIALKVKVEDDTRKTSQD